MATLARAGLAMALAACFAFPAREALASRDTFLDSKDAKESGEPHAYLRDYNKLAKGKDADWVYFPQGSLKKYKTVSVKAFGANGRSRQSREAAQEGRSYMEQWLEREGFRVVKSGGELSVSGNVFNAWEPHGAARSWGGWLANPGVGLEVMARDSSGKTVGEVRHKARGSTVRDAVENGLKDVAKALVSGR